MELEELELEKLELEELELEGLDLQLEEFSELGEGRCEELKALF